MKITSTSRSTGSSTKENEDLDMTTKDLDHLYLSDDSSSDSEENLLVKESEYMAQARAEAESGGAKVDEKSEMVVLTTEQISQASEERRMANTMVFGQAKTSTRRVVPYKRPSRASKLRFSPRSTLHRLTRPYLSPSRPLGRYCQQGPCTRGVPSNIFFCF